MAHNKLHFTVRTPHEIIVETDVVSLRVLTETGHVGLRPRMERIVLAVEAGLIVFRTDGKERYAGSAGGLLRCDGNDVVLLTPMAVVGDSRESIRQALDEALSAPSAEMEARATLGRLEDKIMKELRRERQVHVRHGGESL